MREFLLKVPEYQERVKERVYENMENCERLAKCMEALKWGWVSANADNGIPNALEIHDKIINRFEQFEHYLIERPTEGLMDYDGSYTAKIGGVVLQWFWNPKTFELYDFELMFDIWGHKI